MRCLRILLIVSCCCILNACNGRIQHYVDFLYSNMSFADSICTTRQYWEDNTRIALEARRQAGWDIPEKAFLHYVLPVRVNNEPLDDFRTVYGNELRARVKGMSAKEAAMEINHWCHEMATYTPCDGRTSSPLQTIRRKEGRCGEESVLAVAALRAVGIPARQVYTPRWAHTDDNHAWVEVLVDGRWWFMGACEPAPTLNMAWFNAPVSRVMLLHTRAFGSYEGEEDIIERTADHTEINVTGSYVDTHRTEVQVVDSEGKPVEGASVDFCIYNYAELYTVARYTSGKDGKVGLTSGKGDMIVRAYKDGLYGYAKVNGKGRVVLDKKSGQQASFDFLIVPPAENPIPANVSPEDIAINDARLAREDSIRAARPSDSVVKDYLARHDTPEARALVASLSLKDRSDVAPEVLEEALACPRVELENLVPYFAEIRRDMESEGLHFSSNEEVRKWVDANIKVDSIGNPRKLRIPPIYVWRSRLADPLSKDIFYVALCRVAGLEAEYDPVHGQVAEKNGEMHKLSLSYQALPWLEKPKYYRHFSISRIEDGKAKLIALDEGRDWTPADISTLPFESGEYLLTSGIRMADGSVNCHLEIFSLEKDCSVPLVLRSSSPSAVPVIGSMDVEMTYKQDDGPETSILNTVGRGVFMIGILGRTDEPSSHARHELQAAEKAIGAWGRPVLLLSPANDPDGKVARMLDSACEGSTGNIRLPLIAVCDSFGRVFYLSRGYNTSLAAELEALLPRL